MARLTDEQRQWAMERLLYVDHAGVTEQQLFEDIAHAEILYSDQVRKLWPIRGTQFGRALLRDSVVNWQNWRTLARHMIEVERENQNLN